MKIIVVGGSGFIGSNLVPLLARKYGQDNVAYTFNRTRPADYLLKERAIRFDLRSDDPRSFSSFDVMFFVAGNSSHALAISEPDVDLERNVLNLLRALQGFHGHLILLSSAAVYYGREREVSEEDAIFGSFAYGFSKLVAEHYTQLLHEQGRILSYRIFRLTYAFGAGERPTRLFATLRRNIQTNQKTIRVVGDGSSIIQPIPVNYVCQVLADSLEVSASQNQILNLCSSEWLTVIQAIDLAGEAAKMNWDIEFVGSEEFPLRFYCSRHKLDSIFKRPCPNLRESIKSYLLGD